MAEKNWLERAVSYLGERLAAIPSEVEDMAMKKTAQGAAELSQALNSQSNAYVPYGAGQQGLTVEGPQQSYQDMLREASSREAPEPERGIER